MSHNVHSTVQPQVEPAAGRVPSVAAAALPGGAPAPATQLAGYRRVFDIAFCVLVTAFVLGLLAQVFLAGLGAFHHRGAPGPGFAPHEALGNALSIAGWIILVVAVVARASWRTVICTLVVALLAEVAQHALAQFGRDNQWLGALHALDGMFILLLAVFLSVTSIRRSLVRR